MGTAAFARADVFDFKDLDGYEKCLRTDHVVEHVKTGSGAQSRFLDAAEIQNRCVASAGKLLAREKSKDVILQYIKATKAGTAPENAIELIPSIVKVAPAACNDMAVYEVINKSLSHPKEESSGSNFQKARRVAKTCLKDKDYRKDFSEEKESANSYLSANACEILLEEKIVKTCKKD